MEKEIQQLITVVKEAAKDVYRQLGGGWKEEVYQKAMEVALRERGIAYETQRILPITYRDHVIGEAIPDLVVWLKRDNKKKSARASLGEGARRTAIVIDLKWEPGVKEEHRGQVLKYMQELRKQVRESEGVYHLGFVINFTRTVTGKRLKGGFEEDGGVQVLEVKI